MMACHNISVPTKYNGIFTSSQTKINCQINHAVLGKIIFTTEKQAKPPYCIHLISIITQGAIIFWLIGLQSDCNFYKQWFINPDEYAPKPKHFTIFEQTAKNVSQRNMQIRQASTLEPQIFPSPQFQSVNQRIQFNNVIAALEGVIPSQQNVLSGNWQYLSRASMPLVLTSYFSRSCNRAFWAK